MKEWCIQYLLGRLILVLMYSDRWMSNSILGFLIEILILKPYIWYHWSSSDLRILHWTYKEVGEVARNPQARPKGTHLTNNSTILLSWLTLLLIPTFELLYIPGLQFLDSTFGSHRFSSETSRAFSHLKQQESIWL